MRYNTQTSLMIFLLFLSVIIVACDDDNGKGSNGNTKPDNQDTSQNDDSGDDSDNSPGDSAPQDTSDLPPLPDGSRQVGHIINIVNAQSVADAEDLLTIKQNSYPLSATTTIFYDYYFDEYDFIFVFMDHPPAAAHAGGVFHMVHQHADKSLGYIKPVEERPEYGSQRLKGVIASYYEDGFDPPLEHEMFHNWGVQFDPSLGFGTQTDRGHWGLTSVNGQLGGFDASNMHCVTPEDGIPPNCDMETNGKYKFSFPAFFTNVNRDVDYSPLELYMMGLLPASELPEKILKLEGADPGQWTWDENRRSHFVYEADGFSEILTSDIIDLHGEVPLLAEDDRTFNAAFIVVSEEPASDEVMEHVMRLQETFGNYMEPTSEPMRSFEVVTGHRATMTTRLGLRRTYDEPREDLPPLFTCDVMEQNCPEDLTCYGFSNGNVCAVPGASIKGETCETNYDCGYDMSCSSSRKVCANYCNPLNASHPKACQTICPGSSINTADSDGNIVYATCLP